MAESYSDWEEVQRNHCSNPVPAALWPINASETVGNRALDATHTRPGRVESLMLTKGTGYTYAAPPASASGFTVGATVWSCVWVYSEAASLIVAARRGSLGYSSKVVELVPGWNWVTVSETILTVEQTVRWDFGWEKAAAPTGTRVWMAESLLTSSVSAPTPDSYLDGSTPPRAISNGTAGWARRTLHPRSTRRGV